MYLKAIIIDRAAAALHSSSNNNQYSNNQDKLGIINYDLNSKVSVGVQRPHTS